MRPDHAQLSMPHHAQYYSFYITHICSPMPSSKCPGCQQVFEDPCGFANHKRQCCQVKVATAWHLKQFQARNDKNNRILTHATQTGDGRLHIEEGWDGPASIAVDGMPLVRLDPLLALAWSHLNAIRTKCPTPQPPSCIHLADRIKRFDFQSGIRMSFHCILLLWLSRCITFLLANLVMTQRRILSLETLKVYLHLHLLSLSQRHTAPVPIPMGSIIYIQMAKHLIPRMKSIPWTQWSNIQWK